jgi:NAD(P)-dependent dehydrogenase (short-subunit alcohol dehydrogenase family)
MMFSRGHRFVFRRFMQDQNKFVLVTGASKGIGKACALTFARQGHIVFAGYRHAKDGEALQEAGGGKIIPVRLDVTKLEDISAAVRQIDAEVGEVGLDGLVNNAGVAVPGPLEFLPLADIRWQIEVNLLGQIAVTQAFLPLLRKATGRVVNMSSISGRFVYPFFGPYAISKFGLEAFSDGLRRELLPWGMHVASIEPGSIATPIWETTRINSDARLAEMPASYTDYYGPTTDKVLKSAITSGEKGLSTDIVVQAAAHALFAKRPKVRYAMGIKTRWMIRLLPFIPDAFIDSLFKRFLYKL